MSDWKIPHHKKWQWIALFCFLTFLFLALGYFYYRSEIQAARKRVYRELHAIGELKVRQIQEWRRERIAGLEILAQNPYFSDAVAEFVRSPNAMEGKSRLYRSLMVVRRHHRYRDALIISLAGELLMSARGEARTLDAATKQTVKEALSTSAPVFGDLYRCSVCGGIHIDTALPVLGEGNRPAAVLVFQLDPETDLYPFLQSWPTPSKTAETLLVRKEEDHVLFLNELRHRSNTALKFREPLTRTDLPAVMAVLGKEGIVEGKDYRGVEVLADLLPVPGTHWFMVAKADKDEMFARAHEEVRVISLIVALLVILAAVGTGLIFVSSRKSLYKDLYRLEMERAEAREELRIALYSIGDGVITTDNNGQVRHMNRVAEHLTGWTEAEAQGRPLQEVFHIVDEVTREPVESPARRGLREDSIVWLSDYTVLVARDGSECPIADSTAPVRDDNGFARGAVVVFRDQRRERLLRQFAETRISLIEYAATHSLEEILTRSLDEVGIFVDSPIGFYHFVEPDQKTLSLQQWSTRTLKEFCQAEGRGLHYGIDQAGVWVDCVYEKKPVIHNDYALLPHKKGMPEGHAQVIRELVVPVMREGKVVAILGVGNKRTEYTQEDARIVSYLADVTWEIIQRKRVQETLRESEERNRFLADVIENASQPFGIGYPDGRLRYVNRAFCELTGYSEEELRCIDWNNTLTPPEWRETETGHLSELVRTGKPVRYEKEYIRKDGTRVPVELLVHAVQGESGEPLLFQAFVTDLTERKRAEKELLRAKKDWEDVFQGIGHLAIIVDLEGNVLDCNQAALRALGKSGEEVLGTRCYQLFHSQDHRTESCPLALASLTGEFSVEETEVQALGGYYLVKCTPLVDESGSVQRFIHIATDITERKKAEEALRQSETRYRSLFEESMDGVYMATRDGVMLDANLAFLNIFGYSREDVVGRDIRLLYVTPSDRAGFVRAIEQGGVVRDYPLKMKRSNGKELDCLLTSHVRRAEDGTIVGYQGIVRDVTEQRNLQRQLLQAQKMEAVGTLAGGIAHDFNNLLQVVLGYSELVLGDEDLPDHLREDLRKIRLAGQSGADLVQRLLTFGRKTEINPLDLDLNQRIRQIHKFLERTIPKMTAIDLILAEDLARIHADPTQVDQVLMNLAVNARDAMPEGGRLVIGTENIVVDDDFSRSHVGAKAGRYVLLRVTDTGSGMDRETLEHVFEPFFTTKEAGRGTGLGLAMVYGIVKHHHGFVNCYSEPGQGTTFNVYFPALASDERLEEAPAKVPVKGGSETILLVDDEELIRDLGSRILTKAGYTVITASDGREALSVYQRNRRDISVVILDLIMPKMGGKQCLEELRQIDSKARVLIASGFAADGQTQEAIEMGARGFIRKPYDRKGMLQAVREVLDADE